MFSPLPKVTSDVNKTEDNNLLAKPSLLVSNSFNTVRHKLLMVSPVISQDSGTETNRPLSAISRIIHSLYWWTVVTSIWFKTAFPITAFILTFWFTPKALWFFPVTCLISYGHQGWENCPFPSLHPIPTLLRWALKKSCQGKMPFWSVPTAVLVPVQLSALVPTEGMPHTSTPQLHLYSEILLA